MTPTDTTIAELNSFTFLADPPPGEPLAATAEPPAPAATVHTFQSKPLFPYDGGVSMLYEELAYGTADTGLFLVGLTFTLLDLQSSYSIYKAHGATAEDAVEGAYAALLEIRSSGPEAYRAHIIARAGKLKRAELREAVQLAERVLRDFALAHPEEVDNPSEASEPVSAAVTPETKKRAAAGQRRGKVKAKREEAA